MPLVRPHLPLSPLFETLGYHIEVNTEAAEAHSRIEISDLHLNLQSVSRGRVRAALLDIASGITASLTADPTEVVPFLTLSLNVSYMVARNKGTMRAKGRITGGGRGTKFVPCDLIDETGQAITASAGVSKRAQTHYRKASHECAPSHRGPGQRPDHLEL